jgi:hypothetical protein
MNHKMKERVRAAARAAGVSMTMWVKDVILKNLKAGHHAR